MNCGKIKYPYIRRGIKRLVGSAGDYLPVRIVYIQDQFEGLASEWIQSVWEQGVSK